MARHKHADLIIAWANGAEIELLREDGTWLYAKYPSWIPEREYRIKPEPKPDIVLYTHISNCDVIHLYKKPHFIFNLKVTLCAKTGELKSAEIINKEK